MNTNIMLVILFAMAAAAIADNLPVAYNQSERMQAIGGDLSLKMLMMDDGSEHGKCYCSCDLNRQPVFLELDPGTIPSADMMAIV